MTELIEHTYINNTYKAFLANTEYRHLSGSLQYAFILHNIIKIVDIYVIMFGKQYTIDVFRIILCKKEIYEILNNYIYEYYKQNLIEFSKDSKEQLIRIDGRQYDLRGFKNQIDIDNFIKHITSLFPLLYKVEDITFYKEVIHDIQLLQHI